LIFSSCYRPRLTLTTLLFSAALSACSSDSPPVDAGTDTGLTTVDTGTDAELQPIDAGTDAGPRPTDTGADAGTAPTDTGADAGTAPIDTGADAGTAPTDTGADAGTAPIDTGFDAGTADVTVGGDAGPRDGGAPPPDTGGPPTIIVAGRALSEGAPLTGATVDVVGRAGATVVTGATGQFSFMLPPSVPYLLRAARASYRTVQETVSSETNIEGIDIDLPTSAEFASILSAISVTEDAGAGALLIRYHVATGTTLTAGLGATLSASGGVRFSFVGENPVRRDTTPTTGDLLLGVANLPVGALTVTPTGPAGITCTPDHETATTRIDAGAITFLYFTCR